MKQIHICLYGTINIEAVNKIQKSKTVLDMETPYYKLHPCNLVRVVEFIIFLYVRSLNHIIQS